MMMGSRIAALRRERGLSQAELASRIRVSPSALGMYEQGRREPSLQTVYLMPPPELEAISSSFVRGFVGVQDWQRWVRECVPANVFNIIASMNKKS